jgi:1-deoxy-D-xylulose-5-phosphate synthase
MSPAGKVAGENFSCRLGEILIEEAKRDDRICAITASMSEGTGLESFRAACPQRFFDVGIAEEHALTFAAGLAADGYKPVTAIYSSFMQRAYDQIIHDIALQQLPVLMCIDRAGLNPGDGATHHGFMDVSFLSAIPGLTIYTPVTFGGLALSVRTALEQGAPAAIRYPNGGENTRIREVFYPDYPDHAPAHIGVRTSYPYPPDAGAPLDAVIVTHGRITAEALTAAETLATEGMTVGVQLCEYIKPYDRLAEAVAARLPDGCPVLFLEEEIRAGGFGMMLSDALTRRGSMAGRSYAILAVDDSFVIQERAEPIYRTAGIDAAAICDTLRGLTAVGHQPQG